MPNAPISDNFRSLIYRKFNIITEVEIVRYDHDFTLIQDIVTKHKQNIFADKDKFLIIHDDTDYYLPNCPYGTSMFNLIKIFTELDIPYSKILLLTNHVGIKKELEYLIPPTELHHNFPTIIDNSIMFHVNNSLSVSESNVSDLDVQEITHHAICMMGCKRIHRNILFNFFKQRHLFKKIATSYNSREPNAS